jgi:hypothetical protein
MPPTDDEAAEAQPTAEAARQLGKAITASLRSSPGAWEALREMSARIYKPDPRQVEAAQQLSSAFAASVTASPETLEALREMSARIYKPDPRQVEAAQQLSSAFAASVTASPETLEALREMSARIYKPGPRQVEAAQQLSRLVTESLRRSPDAVQVLADDETATTDTPTHDAFGLATAVVFIVLGLTIAPYIPEAAQATGESAIATLWFVLNATGTLSTKPGAWAGAFFWLSIGFALWNQRDR